MTARGALAPLVVGSIDLSRRLDHPASMFPALHSLHVENSEPGTAELVGFLDAIMSADEGPTINASRAEIGKKPYLQNRSTRTDEGADPASPDPSTALTILTPTVLSQAATAHAPGAQAPLANKNRRTGGTEQETPLTKPQLIGRASKSTTTHTLGPLRSARPQHFMAPSPSQKAFTIPAFRSPTLKARTIFLILRQGGDELSMVEPSWLDFS